MIGRLKKHSMMNNKNLLVHFVEQAITPTKDKDLWIAYLILNRKYPDVRYWAVDTFHVEAIVDYEQRLILGQRHGEYSKLSSWEGEFDWDKLNTLHEFNTDLEKLTAYEIVNTWMGAIGESLESKRTFINSFRRP